jgi:AAA+ ATPase superfamily predicted ATPase
MMQKLVLDASDPLYGRADVILKLGGIPYPYLRELLEVDDIQAIEEYSVWGGVPRYWELRAKEETLPEAIRYNLLSTNGTLYEEPMRLFLDDLSQTTQAETILSVIGNGCHRLSEIAARLGKKSTDLGNPLNILMQLGYVERELPFGENIKNSKKTLYHIADPFMDFYYRFIIPNRSLIGLGHTVRVEQRIMTEFSRYVSMHWEKLCRDAVSGNELLGHVWDVAARWWGNASETERLELDVVALSEDKKHLLVGECKWTKGENVAFLMQQLREKGQKLPFAQGKEIIPVLFLKQTELEEIPANVLLPDGVARLVAHVLDKP